MALADSFVLEFLSFAQQAPPYIETPEVSLVSLEDSGAVLNASGATSATDAESVISLNFDWRSCRQGKTWRRGESEPDANDSDLPDDLK